jgi:hypothetical protein
MSPERLEPAIAEFLSAIRERLDHAAAVARAAECCAQAGHPDQAITIILDIEQPLYETTTFLNAASLINRCIRS